MKKLLFILFLLCTCGWLTAQPIAVKKQLEAMRVTDPIRIDGQLDEAAWREAPLADGFMQLEPKPGVMASQRTEVRILYDDRAIYIGAKLYDTRPDSILKELTQRDNFGNTDWFGISIDAYRDGLNGVGFYVSPAGVQYDLKYSALGNNNGGNQSIALNGDANWDAVWDSEVEIGPDGWVAEMKIPYAAIRFSSAEEQSWHINFTRMIRRNRETSFWNEAQPDIQSLLLQSGILAGLKGIDPPVRFSAYPFVVAYAEHHNDPEDAAASGWGTSFSGGMDIKYGLNDAFTLDMTLIPDFGQVQSDNQVLNLSPFEVQFDENRQFFTEGTELFNKGGLFYSRRVGGQPLRYYDVEDALLEGDSIVSNPFKTQLYNATKVSGRTKGGFGAGFFNATAARTVAKIENSAGEVRAFETAPLTNYNVLAFDQNLPNNSYVSLVNTNVMRSGATYDANVTGTEFLLRNKANSYSVKGGAALSQLYGSEVELGHGVGLEVSKTSGAWQGSLGYFEQSDKFDMNDLGFLPFNNRRSVYGGLWYNRYEPFGYFNRAGGGLSFEYNALYAPSKYRALGLNTNVYFVTKNFYGFGVWYYTQPFEEHNYYEARTDDFSLFYRDQAFGNIGSWVSSDYRKRLAYDVNVNYFQAYSYDELVFGDRPRGYDVSIRPRYRVSDKLSFRLGLAMGAFNNGGGYVDELSNGTGVFGIRDRLTVNNTLNASYTFSPTMGLSFRLRHYWSRVVYDGQFYRLLDDGHLSPLLEDLGGYDTSFNSFNIDMIYSWRFAPGSDIFVVWKNAIYHSSDDVSGHYIDNLTGLPELAQTNNFSVKVVYFLDYLRFVKRKA